MTSLFPALSPSPTSDLEAGLSALAAQAASINAQLSNYLPLGGGTVTGPLTVTGTTNLRPIGEITMWPTATAPTG